MRLLLGIVVILFLDWCEKCSAAVASPPPVHELEEKARDYRRKYFQRGHVVLNSVNTGSSSQQTEFEYDITFDADQIRFDRKSRLLGSTTWAEPQKYVVTKILFIEDIRKNLVVRVGSRNVEHSSQFQVSVFHPQALGMTVGGTAGMVHDGIDALLGRSDNNSAEVSEQHLGDLQTWRIDYKRKGGTDVSVWIAPSQGYGIVRAETRVNAPKGQIMQTVVSGLKEYPQGNIWYPQRSESELSFNGEIQNRQVITVVSATFDSPVDPAVFTLRGLGIAPGRIISDGSKGRRPVGMKWDGTKPVELSARKVGPVGRLGNKESSHSWLLIGNSIVCAILACIFVVRFFRTRRPSGQ